MELNEMDQFKKGFLDVFNFTLNEFALKKLTELLSNPLNSKEKIYERQDIIKAFIQNRKVFQNYFYHLTYLNASVELCQKTNFEDISAQLKGWWFLKDVSGKEIFKSKIKLFLLFFHRLQYSYFSKIKMDVFPITYQVVLKQMQKTIIDFTTVDYEELIRENKFSTQHLKTVLNQLIEKTESNELEAFWTNFFEFETYVSLAQAIFKNQFIFPKIGTNNLILNGFYYPSLKDKVLNDVQINDSVVLVTGPNMSGKSTLMKALYLSVYLSHLGIGIPAASASIPLFDGFFARFNQTDDIGKGYSHFYKEIISLKKVLNEVHSGKTYFAVFDELFSGTNTEDALQIFQKTLIGLSKKKGSLFLVSTHFNQLKTNSTFNLSGVEIYHLECKLSQGKPHFTYKLKDGWSDIRLGKILFEQEGIENLL